MSTTPWPVEFRLSDRGRLLKLSFDDGASFELPAEYLRVESPSAEVQGHGPGQRTTPRFRSRWADARAAAPPAAMPEGAD